MVSRPTGRPHGRPKKERPPKAPVGRPKIPLTADHDRYSIALLGALTKHLGLDARPAARLAAAFIYGIKVEPGHNDWKFAQLSELAKMTPGAIAIQFGRDKSHLASTTTLEGRADTLREKLRRPQSGSAAEWLRLMTDATALTLTAERAARHHIVAHLAKLAGEGAFYDAVLRPAIDAKLTAEAKAQIIAPAEVNAEMVAFLSMIGA